MRPPVLLPVLALAAATSVACGGASLRPPVESAVAAPSAIVDFAVLYHTNCAGCHGPNGEGGVALGLGHPVYLAIANDATVRRVAANGVAGTGMPAFAQAAGGMLTDAQIDAIVRGMRARWARPYLLEGVEPPPYTGPTPGDPRRGAGVYLIDCASCHGPTGRGGPSAGSIVEAPYLTLVSDQSLRTTIIAGRPEIGHPDWRATASGEPMSPEDVSDVVAWLAAQRPQSATQQKQSRRDTP
jgi:mono/diheme cytochrome c family protein